MSEQCLMSHSTHNRSFQRPVFPGNPLHWYWHSNSHQSRENVCTQKPNLNANCPWQHSAIWYGLTTHLTCYRSFWDIFPANHLTGAKNGLNQIKLQSNYNTSTATGRHRGPKQKLRAGYRAPSLKRTFCLSLSSVTHVIFFIIKCGIACFVCTMHVFEVWASSSCPRLPLCQISFLSRHLVLS